MLAPLKVFRTKAEKTKGLKEIRKCPKLVTRVMSTSPFVSFCRRNRPKRLSSPRSYPNSSLSPPFAFISFPPSCHLLRSLSSSWLFLLVSPSKFSNLFRNFFMVTSFMLPHVSMFPFCTTSCVS